MSQKNLIYVMRKFDFAGSSQVTPLLLSYSKKRRFDRIFLLISSQGFNKRLADQVDALTRAGIRVSRYHDAAFLHRRLAIRQVRSLAKKIDGIVNSHRDESFVLHARSALVAWFLLRARKRIGRDETLPLLTDFRGTEWAEYLLFTHMKIPVIREVIDAIETRELLMVEKQVYELTDAASCVSIHFKSYLEMMWGTRPDVRVNPCLAQSASFHFDSGQRQAGREFLRLGDNDIVILFSTGGASPWQNIGPILDSFRRLRLRHASLASNLRLLILAPAFEQISVDDPAVTVTSSAPADMNRWLNLADLGIVIRDENIVNRVASPIKVSEYLCAGLPVLTNRGVPMAVDWVENTGFGVVVDELADLTRDELTRLKQLDRNALSAAGTAQFGLDAIALTYDEIYSKLTQSQDPQQ